MKPGQELTQRGSGFEQKEGATKPLRKLEDHKPTLPKSPPLNQYSLDMLDHQVFSKSARRPKCNVPLITERPFNIKPRLNTDDGDDDNMKMMMMTILALMMLMMTMGLEGNIGAIGSRHGQARISGA